MKPEDEFLAQKYVISLHIRFVAQGLPMAITQELIAAIKALAADHGGDVDVVLDGFEPLDRQQ